MRRIIAILILSFMFPVSSLAGDQPPEEPENCLDNAESMLKENRYVETKEQRRQSRL